MNNNRVDIIKIDPNVVASVEFVEFVDVDVLVSVVV